MKGLEEKYLMINNGQQFCTIVRCAYQNVVDYMEFGRSRVSKRDGSIDLERLSAWLVKRRICHRTVFFREKNPLQRFLIQGDIKESNRIAKKRDLFLSDAEVDALLCEMAEGNYELSWNSVEID